MNPNKQSCLVINGNSDNIRHNANESVGKVITHLRLKRKSTTIWNSLCSNNYFLYNLACTFISPCCAIINWEIDNVIHGFLYMEKRVYTCILQTLTFTSWYPIAPCPIWTRHLASTFHDIVVRTSEYYFTLMTKVVSSSVSLTMDSWISARSCWKKTAW